MIKRLSDEQNVDSMPADVLFKIQTAPLSETSRLKNKFKKAIQKYLEGL
jgi:hypothetical protein